ncbi:homeobox protein 2-like [Venturia canescens]|uniref:homeobox protein 2-like n=1 Tax=Venturia canescens TaxID=32260 RepID=UPI001C9D10AE|nr:homeobox protein 2-like [Venturia canescens]
MQAKIASDVHQIYEPIKRHVTGLTRFVQENEAKSAVVEWLMAQMQLDVNAIRKRVENLENTDKLCSPKTESTRIVPKPEVEEEESDDSEGHRETKISHHDTMPLNHKIKIKAPTYDGSKEKRPMKFIREFRKYCEVINPTFTEMKYLIGQCLEKTAQEWWVLVEEEIDDFEDVETKFINRFWSYEVQRKVRKELEFGKYPEKSKMTKVEYATRTFGTARDLIPPPSDKDIVASLSQHFTEEIRATIISRGFLNLEQLIEFLEKLDQSGPVNTGIEEETPPKVQSHKNNSDKNEPRPFKMPQNGGYQNQNWKQNGQPNNNWQRNNSGNNGGYNNNNWNHQQSRNFNQQGYQQNNNQRPNNGYSNQRPKDGNFRNNQQNWGNNYNNRPPYNPNYQNRNSSPPNQNNGSPYDNEPKQQAIQTIEAKVEPQPSTSKAGNA